MKFRYFDAAGKQLTTEQLKSMRIATPAMEHIFATVVDRIEKTWNQSEKPSAPSDKLENCESK